MTLFQMVEANQAALAALQSSSVDVSALKTEADANATAIANLAALVGTPTESAPDSLPPAA